MTESSKPTLRDIVAPPVMCRVGGAVIELQPMGWYQASIAIDHLLPVFAVLPPMDGKASNEELGEHVFTALTVHRDAVSAFCAAASGLPEDDIRRLQPTHLVELVLVLLEVNADFFAQSLPAMAQRAVQRLAPLKQKLLQAVVQAKAYITSFSA